MVTVVVCLSSSNRSMTTVLFKVPQRILQRLLSPVVIQYIAKQVGFVQRSSKYQADELIALCVWLSQEVASTSLTQLCSRLEASTGVLMSPEGLN